MIIEGKRKDGGAGGHGRRKLRGGGERKTKTNEEMVNGAASVNPRLFPNGINIDKP